MEPLYTYDLTGGVLNALTPSSNGELQFNEDTNQLGIFKFDNSGRDFRSQLQTAINNNSTGRIMLRFGDGIQARSFEFDGTDGEGVYNGTYFRIPITNINGGTAGDGKVVGVEIQVDNQVMGPGDAFRLPGGGDTFDSVVTQLNGFTGGITLNHGAGITTSGASATGITIGIDSTSTIHVAGICGPSGITFSDGTRQTSAAVAGGVTLSVGFILDGSGSPLATGDKLDALRQIPYDCYILNSRAYVQSGISGSGNRIELCVKKVKGLTGNVGSVGATSGVTLELGNSGSTATDILTFIGGVGLSFSHALGNNGNSSGSTLSAGEWIYPFIHGNSADVDKVQLFINLTSL